MRGVDSGDGDEGVSDKVRKPNRPEYENPIVAELERALQQASLLSWPRWWFVSRRIRKALRVVGR